MNMTVLEIYQGSNGAATTELYKRLERIGVAGSIAKELFRAQKASTRAKLYRGGIPGKGSYRRMAYDKKNYSLFNLCTFLAANAAGEGIKWGWKRDMGTPGFEWCLYVDLSTGQASFHSATRYSGPDYDGEWDGKKASADAIIKFCETLLAYAAGKLDADGVVSRENFSLR